MTSPASTSDPVSTMAIRAPKEDLGVVCVPSLCDATSQIQAQMSLFDDVTLSIAGRSFQDLRQQARRELLIAARVYSLSLTGEMNDSIDQAFADRPFVLSGHQPQLTHPGVWAKNVIAGQLAESTGGVAINIVVDNDTIRSRSIVVPTRSENEDGLIQLHQEFVSFDLGRTKIPWEDVVIEDPQTFSNFAQRVKETLAGTGQHPLLEELWTSTFDYAQTNPNLRDVLTFLRRRWEMQSGVKLLDVPLSSVCRLPLFRPFLSHLLEQAEPFASVHNEALRQYRERNSITQSHVPFRDLEIDGEWVETPFWVWHSEFPVRRALFVRRQNGQLELSDREKMTFSCEASILRDDAKLAEVLEKIENLGWKIRTRAVSTTMLARLFLGDYFIHGIGGAKYDEITDQIIREFWMLPVPSYQVVTATAHLSLGDYEKECGEFRCDLDQWRRDWLWNPQAFFDAEGNLVEPWKQMAISGSTAEPAQVRLNLTQLRELLTIRETIEPLEAKRSPLCASKECYYRKRKSKEGWNRELSDLKSVLREQTGVTEEDWSRLISRRKRSEQNRRYANYREYPYVLFSEEKMQALKRALLGNLGC